MTRNKASLSWTLLAVMALTPALLALTAGCKGQTSSAETSAAQAKVVYRCSMHPNVVSSQPGNCSVCGMKLEQVGHETK